MFHYGAAVLARSIQDAVEDEVIRLLETDVVLPREFELRVDFTTFNLLCEVAGHRVFVRGTPEPGLDVPTVH